MGEVHPFPTQERLCPFTICNLAQDGNNFTLLGQVLKEQAHKMRWISFADDPAARFRMTIACKGFIVTAFDQTTGELVGFGGAALADTRRDEGDVWQLLDLPDEALPIALRRRFDEGGHFWILRDLVSLHEHKGAGTAILNSIIERLRRTSQPAVLLARINLCFQHNSGRWLEDLGFVKIACTIDRDAVFERDLSPV